MELLAAAGAEVVSFDPLTAERLPDGTDALVAGGGFPELHADQLTANTALRHDVRRQAAAGLPIVAECAGLLWLGASLDAREQCQVLPARARMTQTLSLGYREATALSDTPLLPAGIRVRAHEFHYTVSEPRHGDSAAWQLSDGTPAAGPAAACWRPTCTCTGRVCPRPRDGWWRPRSPAGRRGQRKPGRDRPSRR